MRNYPFSCKMVEASTRQVTSKEATEPDLDDRFLGGIIRGIARH